MRDKQASYLSQPGRDHHERGAEGFFSRLKRSIDGPPTGFRWSNCPAIWPNSTSGLQPAKWTTRAYGQADGAHGREEVCVQEDYLLTSHGHL